MEENWQRFEQGYLAAPNQKGKTSKDGKGKGGKGKRKGYGEFWDCGQQEHPSRECLVPGKLHGSAGQQAGTAAAFKGKGKYKGKGANGEWKAKGSKETGKRVGKEVSTWQQIRNTMLRGMEVVTRTMGSTLTLSRTDILQDIFNKHPLSNH